MTPDPTMPPPAEPSAQAGYDPWAAMPPAVAPPTEQLPVPPAPFPTPPVQSSAPPATAQFSAVPAVSAPPVQFSAPPATAQFVGPPSGELMAWPGAQPPVPAPLAGPHPPAQSVVAVQIGEIMVAPPVIRTPAGVLPLAGSSWHVMDYWQKEEKVATWAVVCAVLGFFCLTVFSLLFLLVKETKHYGTVQVTVTNGSHQYVARIPVVNQLQVQQINNQVNYARSLSHV